MKPSLAVLLLAAVSSVGCVSSGPTLFDEGVLLYRDGQYPAARDRFDRAVRQDSQDAAAWNNRGVARMRLGDLDGAVADYTRAMQLAPWDAEIAFNRGNAFAAAGNVPAAIGDFTSAVTLRPGYAEAFFNRGSVRQAAGDQAGALTDWQWAIDIAGDPWTRAVMRQGAGLDHAYAMPAARASAPLDARALVARAMARQVDGDRAGALGDLRAALGAETDEGRRARIAGLLRDLEAAR